MADPLTATLGGSWQGSAAVIKVLCIVGVVRAIVAVDGPVLQAAGHPFVQAVVTAGLAVLSAITFAIAGMALRDAGSDAQALGMAVSRAVLFATPVLVVHLLIVRRFAGTRPSRELQALGRPLAVGVVVLVVGSALDILLPGPTIVRLFAVSCGSALAAVTLTMRMVPGCAELARRRLRGPPTTPGAGDEPPVDPPAFAGV